MRNSTNGQLTEAGQLVRTQVAYPANVRYEMKNLKPDTLYRVELRAHNVIGFSAPAEILLRTAKGQFHVSSSSSSPPPIARLDFSLVIVLLFHFLFSH